jgi:restriction endonuclease Mrr
MEDRAMYAVIRTYSGEGAKELFDLLEQRKSDVESLIRSVRGFVSYSLVRTGDGGISVTVCQNEAGADESVQKAKEWIGANASNIGASAPRVLEGPVSLHLKE